MQQKKKKDITGNFSPKRAHFLFGFPFLAVCSAAWRTVVGGACQENLGGSGFKKKSLPNHSSVDVGER